jgi:hypothetical protein
MRHQAMHPSKCINSATVNRIARQYIERFGDQVAALKFVGASRQKAAIPLRFCKTLACGSVTLIVKTRADGKDKTSSSYPLPIRHPSHVTAVDSGAIERANPSCVAASPMTPITTINASITSALRYCLAPRRASRPPPECTKPLPIRDAARS